MMAALSTGELLLIGLGFLGFNVRVGILIWTGAAGQRRRRGCGYGGRSRGARGA
jgi:hypothetical protein